MTEKRLTGEKVFQVVSLSILPFLWVGYFYALYRGNQTNISSYSFGILIFSIVNSDAIFKGEKTPYRVFDVLAKLEGILLVVWGIISIALVLI